MLNPIIRYMIIPAIALVLTINLYKWLVSDTIQTEVKSSGEASIGGSFTLTNQHGQKVSDTDFAGKYMLVYFGFTNCPMICPTDMAVMTQSLDMLDGEADKIQPIFITIDPNRDDVEQINSFASNFYPTLQALTGTSEEIAEVANAYRIYYKKAEAEDLGEYLMDHSAYMYLMGHDGKYITHFRSGQTAEEVVTGLRKYL